MLFPLKFRPKESYHERPRKFGAPRSNGTRKHAGCDLYAPVGTPVFSVADGTIISIYEFYLSTWAIEVDHGDFIVRYGEVRKNMPVGIRAGARISAGRLIGEVGLLSGLKVSMVHFEMYDGTATGPLTQRSNKPYQRRKDLIDPTSYLDAAQLPGLVMSPCFALPGMKPGTFGFTAGML